MKYLFLILITTQTMASNWMPISKIQALSSEAHQLEESCAKSGEQCLDVGDEPQIVKLGFVSLEDNFTKTEVEVCLDEVDCQAKHEAKVCLDGVSIKNLDLLEVYCSRFSHKSLVKNLTAFNAYKATQAQAQALSAGLAQATAAMDCGKRVQALLLVRNSPKGLTKPQVKALVLAYKDIKNLLDTGSLASAKEEIEAITADGVIITSGDKAALIAQINSCLGL